MRTTGAARYVKKNVFTFSSSPIGQATSKKTEAYELTHHTQKTCFVAVLHELKETKSQTEICNVSVYDTARMGMGA